MTALNDDNIGRVEADIRYFEHRLAELAGCNNPRDLAQQQVYRLMLRQRRQLLAALRDGRPDAWPEYAPADIAC